MHRIFRSRRVLLPSPSGYRIAPARVDTRDGFIVQIAPDALDAVPEGAEVVELGDHLLTPAFINAHTHLALAFLRGLAERGAVPHNLVEDWFFRYESKLSAADVRAFTRMGAYESLLSGVGLVWDHYYEGEAVADGLADTGLAGVVAPTLQDLSGPGQRAWEAALEATLRIAGSDREQHGIYAALGPHATDTVSPYLLRTVAELAQKHVLPVHVHLAQSYDELKRVETREGRSPLALLAREGVLDRAPHVVMAHALFMADSDLKSLEPGHHTLVHCPASQMQFAFPGPLARWCSHGVAWVVATDCAASNDSMNLQKELRLCAGAAACEVTASAAYRQFLKHGRQGDARDTWQERQSLVNRFGDHRRAERLLGRVWEQPGRMHPQFRCGVLEPGALANLAVWNVDHPAFWPGRNLPHALAMADTVPALHQLFVRGRAIGEAGHLVSSVLASGEFQHAKREADERLARLLR